MIGASIWKSKDAISSAVIFWEAMITILAISFLAGGIMLGENFDNMVKSDSLNLRVSIPDSRTLMLEHIGGDAINFTEDTKVYLCFKEEKLELSSDSSDCDNTLLEVGGLKKFTLPEKVIFEKGNLAVLKIVDEKRKKEIYIKKIQLP